VLLVFVVEKAAYEISYEAGKGPDGIEIPLAGLESLLGRLLAEGGDGQ
jgi:predicted trehalose synthase